MIYPLKTDIHALGFLSVHLRVKKLNKGVRYAQIKISERAFHSLVFRLFALHSSTNFQAPPIAVDFR